MPAARVPGHDADQRSRPRRARSRRRAPSARAWSAAVVATIRRRRGSPACAPARGRAARARGRPGAARRGTPPRRRRRTPRPRPRRSAAARGRQASAGSGAAATFGCRRRWRQTTKAITPSTKTPAAIGPAAVEDVLGHVAEEVDAEGDAGRPHDPAERVPEQERRPRHLVHARPATRRRSAGRRPSARGTPPSARAWRRTARPARAPSAGARGTARAWRTACARPCGRSRSRRCRR